MGKRIVTAVKQRFSIRKLSIGAASVLLGTSLYFMGASAPVVHADTTGAPAAPEKEKTGTNDPVYVAKDSTKNDADVNNAIDKYAEYALEHDLKNKDNKVIIRPSDKQPVKVNTIKDRVNQVNNIQNDIQTKIKKANQGWDAINTCKKSNNHEIIDGKDSSYFENQSLSVDDEKDSEINQITVTDGSKTKNVNTKLVDRKSKNIDGYGINITHTSYITDKEKYTMKVNSNNKVIVDFQDNQCKGKEITVTYDNLNNSYYLENKTNRIKISRIDRTFSSIIQADNSHLFNPNGKDTYKNDAIYDECRGPQLIIYNDPSDGFFYNNIKQISVKDTYYYDDKGEQKPIDIKNPAWVFVTSLNSNPSGNIEKVRALRPDNSPVPVLVPVNAEKIAGSTVTDHNDGWCYSNINNNFSNNANNIFGQKLDWDNNDEYNRFGFVGTVAFQYHPGMTLQYRADDSQWGSHWACMQTQVVSSLNENVIIYGHIKDSTENVTRNDTVTRTIHYLYDNSNTAQPDKTQTVSFNETGTKDDVTGETTWSNDNAQTVDNVNTPSIVGYTPDKSSIEKQAFKFGYKDVEVTVTYNPDQQKAKVLFIDDTTKNTLDTHNLTGVTNGHESYNPSEEINQFVDKHYVLVSSDYPDNGFTYDNDNSKDQVFEVHLKHGTHDISDKKSITETVTYKMSDGSKAPDKVEKQVEFSRDGYNDEVTKQDHWNKWQPNKQSFSAVPTPDVTGYTPDIKLVEAKTVTSGDKDITETVTYNPDQQKAKVLFIDDTTKNTLDTHNLTGVTNGHESYNPSEEINQFVDKHYVLVSSDYPDNGFTYDNDNSKDQVFEVHLKHGTHDISDKKSITETVTYKMSDGSKAPDKVEKQVEFSRDGYNDEVTKQDHWNKWQPNKQSFSAVPTPDVTGYTPDIKLVEAKTVTSGDKDITETVTYNPDQQKAKVLFIDDTTKNTLDTHNLTGVTNGHESYNPSEEINQFVDKHYVLVSSDYPDNGFTYDNDNSKDQVFEVHLKHGTHDISDKKSITETVTYKMSDGSKAPDKVEKQVEFSRDGYNDEVTKQDHWNKWQPNKQSFSAVPTPDVTGYTPDIKLVEAKTVTSGDKDITETVTYNPDQQKAKVLFIDDTTKNTLDTHNLTGVTNGHESYNPSEEINQFVDKHYVLVSSDYPDNGFTYDNDNSKDQVFEVHLKHGTHDISDKKSITETVTYKMSDGSKAPDKVEKQVEFSRDGYNDEVTKQDHWNKWQPNKQSFSAVPTPDVTGYTPDIKLVEAKTVTSGDKDITETVTYNPDQQKAKVLFIDDTTKNTLDTHNLTGVTNGHESYNPSEEINQFVDKHYVLVSSDYPDNGFTYDNDNSKDQVFEVHLKHGTHDISDKKSITETVTYKMSDGSKAPDKVEKQVEFSRDGYNDEVTKQDHWNKWQPNKQSFSAVPTPDVTGYTPDIKLVEAKTVTSGDKDITETVTYNPDQQKAKVLFIDDTTKNTLDTHNLTGVTNGHESYNPSEEINQFVDKHYVLVSSDYPDNGFTYDNDNSKDQVFEVHLVHTYEPVETSQTITETVHYIDANGKPVAPDHVAKAVIKVTGTRDKVTDSIIWNTPSTGHFDEVISPEVPNMTPDKKLIPGRDVQYGDSDITESVVYTPDNSTSKTPEKPDKPSKEVSKTPEKPDKPSKEVSKIPEKPIDSRTVDNHVSAKSTAKRELPQTGATTNTGIWTGLVSMIASLGLLGASKKRKKN